MLAGEKTPTRGGSSSGSGPARAGRAGASACAGRPAEVLERLEAELRQGDDAVIDLPISIYGGG